MTLLGGDLAALFGELLAGEYLPGSLRANIDTYDERGNLARGGEPVECRVQVESATETMRQAEGYTADDVAVFVLAKPGGALPDIDALNSNHEITVLAGPYAGSAFKVGAPISRDPGAAYWLCRGVRAQGSASGG